MNPLVSTSTPAANGADKLHDLFALTDEQILQIEPEAQDVEVVSDQQSAAVGEASREPRAPAATVQNDKSVEGAALGQAGAVQQQGQPTTSNEEPPAWLTAQMKDPWSGEEAKELWNGVQQARQEAAAYRAAFATPEDAHALKELYPGGVNEARASAERARVLDDIDRAYFGGAGKSPQEVSASRAQLTQMLLREDPAAFREMVFAGLRALEEAGVAAGFSPPAHGANATTLPRLAKAVGAEPVGAGVAPPFRAASSGTERQPQCGDAGQTPGIPTESSSVPFAATAANGTSSSVGARHAVPVIDNTQGPEAHAAAYAAFEKAANEDLERSVGAVISRTIEQALPNVARSANTSAVGAQHAAPLQARVSAAIRQDVEAALKDDRQLGEQITQILSARRFDAETRGQVVRLIGERAQQLVPVAAKRVLNDWTQTTLAAHRGNAARGDAASARREVAPVNSESRRASLPAGSTAASHSQQRTDPNRGVARSRAVDYRKLSDEQILDL